MNTEIYFVNEYACNPDAPQVDMLVLEQRDVNGECEACGYNLDAPFWFCDVPYMSTPVHARCYSFENIQVLHVTPIAKAAHDFAEVSSQ